MDAILAGLGAQIKQQVRDGVPDEGDEGDEGDELEAEGIMNDSALWAYDDPSEG